MIKYFYISLFLYKMLVENENDTSDSELLIYLFLGLGKKGYKSYTKLMEMPAG